MNVYKLKTFQVEERACPDCGFKVPHKIVKIARKGVVCPKCRKVDIKSFVIAKEGLAG